MLRIRVLLAGMFGVLASVASASGPTMSYEPVWPGLSKSNGYTPLRVEVKNPDQDTFGMLTTVTQFGSMAYPVELPRGSDKIVTVYLPAQRWYQQGRLELQTTTARLGLDIELKEEATGSARYVGVVSSTDGLLASLRRTGHDKRPLWDTTTKPEFAPTRAVAYEGLAVVVLAEGSERLSDESIGAIQRYLLAGGRLLVTGGASAPWLRDPRWQSVMPVTAVSTRTFAGLQGLTRRAGSPVAKPVSVAVTRPNPGADVVVRQDGTPLIVQKQVGLGTVEFWAFDPFAPPLQTWIGRDVLVRGVVSDDTRADAYLGRASQDMGPYGGYPYYGRETDASDPFITKMPPAWKIVLALFGFLTVVIPINFLVLQKARRREWAWITVPIVSLGFSALIFGTASSLYSVGATRVTNGTVIAHEGLSQAVFEGSQQLFLPRAGVYDFGYQGVEAARDSARRYDMFGGQSNFGKPPEMIDVGQVVAPRVEATNLTFRSTELTQVVPFEGRISFVPVVVESGGKYSVRGTMTNATKLALRGCRLVYGSYSDTFGDVRPGQSVKVDVMLNKSPERGRGPYGIPPTAGCLALECTADGLEIGTNLGTEPGGRRGCRLLYTWNFGGPTK